jgi:hypothetical protein
MPAIYRGPKKSYSLTGDDVLWLARAFVGEFEGHQTRKNACVHFWCWMDRFLLVQGKWMTTGMEFWEFLRSHSQAINPIWMKPGEEKCAGKTTGPCDQASIARRHRMCALQPEDMKKAYAWALEAQEGKLEQVSSEVYYDFAACANIKKYQSYRPCPGDNFDGQCFLPWDCLTDSERKKILPGRVELGTQLTTVGIGLGGVLFAAAVGWAIYTLVRK